MKPMAFITPILKKRKCDSNTDNNVQVDFVVQNYFDMEDNYNSFSEDNCDSSS